MKSIKNTKHENLMILAVAMAATEQQQLHKSSNDVTIENDMVMFMLVVVQM